MKIKVCGLKDTENIKAVAALGPDHMGFIFYSLTPRFAEKLSLETLKSIPASIHKTAVFVNESAEVIKELIDQYGFDTIQLHGSEGAGFCGQFKGKVTVFKAFGISESFDFSQLNEYKCSVDYFLFDTKTVVHGGSGKTFNWDLLNQYQLNVPFFLSGGIGPENLEDVKNISHPQFYGVDLNSKFEISPGIKDIQKLETAFNSLKQIQYK